jgi:phytoene dehydrogenase-like protein
MDARAALLASSTVVAASMASAVRELGKLATIGKRLWQVGGLRAFIDLFRKSAGDTLDHWFDSDPIKAVLGFDSIVGNLASPYAPGSAYVLLHHVIGEVNGKRGIWGHALGGMAAITKAMAGAASEHGADRRLLDGRRNRRGVWPSSRRRFARRDRNTGPRSHFQR